jgi:hypothetical protein
VKEILNARAAWDAERWQPPKDWFRTARDSGYRKTYLHPFQVVPWHCCWHSMSSSGPLISIYLWIWSTLRSNCHDRRASTEGRISSAASKNSHRGGGFSSRRGVGVAHCGLMNTSKNPPLWHQRHICESIVRQKAFRNQGICMVGQDGRGWSCKEQIPQM